MINLFLQFDHTDLEYSMNSGFTLFYYHHSRSSLFSIVSSVRTGPMKIVCFFFTIKHWRRVSFKNVSFNWTFMYPRSNVHFNRNLFESYGSAHINIIRLYIMRTRNIRSRSEFTFRRTRVMLEFLLFNRIKKQNIKRNYSGVVWTRYYNRSCTMEIR